jgi:hypothetical protein
MTKHYLLFLAQRGLKAEKREALPILAGAARM